MTGVHVVRKPHKSGIDTWHVYAWRGGPSIHKCTGPRPVIDQALLSAALAEQAKATKRGGRIESLDDVIDEYRGSPEFARLADRTKSDYRMWLDRISAKFGRAPIAAFNDQRMRREIVEWRDGWSSQPRSADRASMMMATLLGWAMERAIVTVNVAARIPQMHRVDKSDQVWEAHHWQALADAKDKDGKPAIPAHLMDVIRLARLTGLRLGDLVRLTWEQVGEKAIVIDRTRKRKRRAVIPILPELRALLKQLEAKIPKDKDEHGKRTGPQRRTGPVLRNSRGEGWGESGVKSVWQRVKPEGFDRVLHDLRGTYVTFLATHRLTDQEISRIVGWTSQRIAEIRARYVDEERVIVSLVDRLSA
ncbi:MAG: tyrosine-type recombinase/integrase [Novosphingobium sp.]|uniref:tyrosine-type recombinase/integrase n=1 Tax=Novosphingobium sp. TaxID=1874826 RepID=UPI0027353C19|nr:tyrosine-type recombinase/integrase [Novosphingobium sp.]MDP3550650.1 tyrosine-type recombinase/integrase [Novosphingobium sp.]